MSTMSTPTTSARDSAPGGATSVVPADVGYAPAPADPVAQQWPESQTPVGPRPLDPPLSPRTGEPRRPALLTLVCALFGLATLFYAVETIATFWRIVHAWRGATLLIRSAHPRENSVELVLLAVLAVLQLAAVAAAAAYAGFQAWNGWFRARWVAVAAVVLAILGFAVNTVTLWGLLALVPAAVLLWLPRLTRYNRHQSLFRWVRANPVSRAPLPGSVPYGPLPKYRRSS